MRTCICYFTYSPNEGRGQFEIWSWSRSMRVAGTQEFGLSLLLASEHLSWKLDLRARALCLTQVLGLVRGIPRDPVT